MSEMETSEPSLTYGKNPMRRARGAVMNIVERRIALTAETFATLQLGYAITVHKAQGNQWLVCILMLPAHASHMPDRALLYTAATRASEKLIFCGDRSLLERATSCTRSPT